MITSIEEFLRYFDAVHRRAVRDVGMLPAEAESWRPAAGEGENAWDIGQLVAHMAGSRLYFASAYRNEGWVTERWPEDTSRRQSWVPALERSAQEFKQRLAGTPDAWLQRRIELIDTPDATISGWRTLMMMVEHDIHHRSQIDTYAGINAWPVPDIYGRKAEQIGELRDQQLAKYSRQARSQD
ncbi:MAG: DinB family protein [Dehalococcoidia bacterium]